MDNHTTTQTNIDNHADAPCNLTAGQQARAMHTLQAMVDAQLEFKPMFIGPDSGYKDAQTWLQQYLPLMNSNNNSDNSSHSNSKASPHPQVQPLHAVTHHVYPGARRTNFNHPQFLDSTQAEIDWFTDIVTSLAPGASMWAGEDGPIGGGDDGTCGKDSVCGTYASSIWYADDLANRAKHGFTQYQRQTMFGGAYGLTDTAVAHPQSALGLTEALLLRPDYWVNFLWKRTIGTNVYNVSSSSPLIRAYAFSGEPGSPFSPKACHGAIQLLIINLDDTRNTTIASLPEIAGAAGTYAAWTLSPPTTQQLGLDSVLDPFSKRVLLNEQLLPTVVDVLAGDPMAFLKEIPIAPTEGDVSDGIVLSPLAISLLCY